MRAVESLKVYTLMGSCSPKHRKIYMKKNRRVMHHETEEWCKTWRRTNPWFQKWHEEFGEFWRKQWQVWKYVLWWITFDIMFKLKECIVWKKVAHRISKFWKSVSPNSKRGGENYDLLCQNSFRKYEDDLEH